VCFSVKMANTKLIKKYNILSRKKKLWLTEAYKIHCKIFLCNGDNINNSQNEKENGSAWESNPGHSSVY